MKANELRIALRRVTEVLIAEQLDYLMLKEAIESYKTILLDASGLDLKQEGLRENILLKHGQALGTEWAAFCVDDMMRTKRFISGIFKAVKDLNSGNSGKPVEILYSGTGPFATLVLPLITCFKSSEIQFVLIEINPISYNSVLQVFKSFKATDYIKSIHKEDATEFRIPNPDSIDIVIAECLQRALEKESQVAITFNLMKQLKPEVILIPATIGLKLAVFDTAFFNGTVQDNIDESPFEIIEELFRLDKDLVMTYKDSFDPNYFDFPSKEVTLNHLNKFKGDSLVLLTEIHVYDDQRIGFNESGLTNPLIISSINRSTSDSSLSAHYRVNELPKLHIELKRK